MTSTTIQPILEAVALRTRSVADADRAIQEQVSGSTSRVKLVTAGFFLLLFLGMGVYLIQHAVRLTTTQPTTTSSWPYWLPLLLFGGFGSLMALISIVGLSALVRTQRRLTSEFIQQTLVLVSTGVISATEGTQRLTGQSITSSATRSPSLLGRLVVGVLLIAVVYFSLQSIGTSWRLLVYGLKTDGKVVGLARNSKGNKSAPVVRYSVDRKVHELTGKTYSSPAAYEVGESVVVLYEPGSPEVGAIQSFSEQWAGPLLGLFLSGCFLVVFLRSWRGSRPTS